MQVKKLNEPLRFLVSSLEQFRILVAGTIKTNAKRQKKNNKGRTWCPGRLETLITQVMKIETRHPGGKILPYTGMCRLTGYNFCSPSCAK